MASLKDRAKGKTLGIDPVSGKISPVNFGAGKPAPVPAPKKEYVRYDGTLKDTGFLGRIPIGKTGFATEYSTGNQIDGKEVEMPSLVPTLTPDEVKTMATKVIPNDGKIPDQITRKVIDHAKMRIKAGLSPFFDSTKEGR